MSTASEPNEPIIAQILIVEDEEEHADVMGEALRRLGHVITVVNDIDGAHDYGSF
ncbi:MAG: hypothetical protein JKY96_04645 [Phycisphaerales bacterium]|nr:hypothetical protein [Phycisphaerales bacterium]